MALNKTQTKYFSSGDISFSQIKNTFGGNANNIKASDYLRNVGSNVDWDESQTTPKVPDAKENVAVSTDDNWTTSSLRDTIREYSVIQSGNNEELSFTSADTGTWNGNLNRNILKNFSITGTVYANETNKYALAMSGNLYNLEIDVESAGKVYGEGGASGGGNGGSALYVNNTYTNSDVELRVYGRVWSGGGGGIPGNSGNSGPSLSCSSTSFFNTSNPFTSGVNLSAAAPGQSCRAARSGATWVNANQNSVRDRCRGGGARRGNGVYPGGSYQCSSSWTILCRQTNTFNKSGGPGGSGGTGGPGRGFTTQSASLAGNSGNSGNCNSCSGGGTSCGNSGNPGGSGAEWGESAGGNAGIAVHKKNTRIEYYTVNTIKGPIKNL